MCNYNENGKQYIIYNTSAPVYKLYYGSTGYKTLKQRLRVHESMRDCEARSIIDTGTYAIELLENYPCDNKEQLEDREAEYIVANWDSCVNIKIPGAIRRAGGVLEYDRKRNKTPKRKAQQKKYYDNNAEKINARQREKIECDLCGAFLARGNIAAHKKSKKCRAAVHSQVKNVLDDMIEQLC